MCIRDSQNTSLRIPSPQIRRQNPQLLAILRDGAAGDLHGVFAEDGHDVLVAEGLGGVFLADDLRDAVLDLSLIHI